jgi:hypothetical protein
MSANPATKSVWPRAVNRRPLRMVGGAANPPNGAYGESASFTSATGVTHPSGRLRASHKGWFRDGNHEVPAILYRCFLVAFTPLQIARARPHVDSPYPSRGTEQNVPEHRR